MLKWQKVLSSHFPIKKLRRHVGTIFGCFEILSAGIKPSFVWDFFTADIQQLQQAVAYLKMESLVHSEITVLALSQGVGTQKWAYHVSDFFSCFEGFVRGAPRHANAEFDQACCLN
jgi:hypothetical protein